MIVRYFKIALVWSFFISISSMEGYAADNLTMVRCLMKRDKNQIVACVKEKFPKFYKILCPWIGGCDNIPENLRGEIEKGQLEWLEAMVESWQVLYDQCSHAMSAEDCIAKIDISSCKDVGGYRDEEEPVGGFGRKGRCFGLAAFLKKDKSICENQPDFGVRENCNMWLKALSEEKKGSDMDIRH